MGACDLEGVPFPVAYPLAFARDESLPPSSRVDNTIFAGYQAMRTTALLLLAEYLACDTVAVGLGSAIRGLRMPHWQEWSVLCDQLCAFWEGRLDTKPSRETYLPGLVRGWREVNHEGQEPRSGAWAELLAGLAGRNGRAQSANDALWMLRNGRAHRMQTRTLEVSEEVERLRRFLPVVDMMARTLFEKNNFRLLRRVDRGGGRAPRHQPIWGTRRPPLRGRRAGNGMGGCL